MAGWKTWIGPGAGLVLTLALGGGTGLQAGPATDAAMRLCELVIDVDRVPVQAEPIAVAVRHSASFGDTILARLPAESRIRVLGVVNTGKEEPQTLRITLNTSEAVPGEYELIVDDGQAECMGTIVIGGKTDGVASPLPGVTLPPELDRVLRDYERAPASWVAQPPQPSRGASAAPVGALRGSI